MFSQKKITLKITDCNFIPTNFSIWLVPLITDRNLCSQKKLSIHSIPTIFFFLPRTKIYWNHLKNKNEIQRSLVDYLSTEISLLLNLRCNKNLHNYLSFYFISFNFIHQSIKVKAIQVKSYQNKCSQKKIYY